MNIIQAVRYILKVLIPQVTPIAGEGIEVAKEKEGSVISATFPGWLPHGEVYVFNGTNAAWPAGTVVALTTAGIADPEEDTLDAVIPSAGADGQFAVLADTIPVQDDGLAAVTGLAVARMSAGFTDAFAVPDGLLIARPFIFAGPYVGLKVSNQFRGSDWTATDMETIKNGLNKAEWGLGAGLGINIFKFQITGKYNWNFGSIADTKQMPDLASTPRTFEISVGLRF